MFRKILVIAALVLLLGAGQPGVAIGDTRANPDRDSQTLRAYAVATWASLAAMTDPHSGLPADSLGDDGVRSVQTSTTNIGAYLWSAVAAQRLGIIDRPQLLSRVGTTLSTLEHLERDSASG